MSIYNLIAASNESTVVTEYIPDTARSDAYRSEERRVGKECM